MMEEGAGKCKFLPLYISTLLSVAINRTDENVSQKKRFYLCSLVSCDIVEFSFWASLLAVSQKIGEGHMISFLK
jgi:hypothetical protein